jgi:putative oxygen-independent coproporphyrinogen III oxidase
MTKAAYFHIPFCTQICHYCDFNKVFLKKQPVEQYLRAMDEEMKQTVNTFGNNRLRTVFVGGGTPTALTIHQLNDFFESIHRHFSLMDDVEFTIEANPNDLTVEKLLLLKEAGVNRLSFGVQTFDNGLLKQIGRSHTKEEALKTIEMAKEMGFTNINIDLMYGLPTQTLQQLKETLDIAFSLGVQHFSAYSLIIEPKTVFYNLMKKGQLPLPEQEEEAEMYEEIMEQMERNGYHQYELSNYAKKGFESRHNLTYWNNEPYYGIGAGAHSYVAGRRNVNAGPLKKYIELVEKNGLPYIDSHPVTKVEQMEEEMFLGLRKTEGVCKQTFMKKYGCSIHDVFGQQIEEQKQKGLLEETSDFIRLTHRGKLLGNEVFQTFIGAIDNETNLDIS